MKRKCLAVGIILLFVGTSIIPSTAQDIEKLSLPTSSGNWLYVGGSGPGNYTSIRLALADASDGDTVFVYSGIYTREGISIKKSIRLIGENKTTTVLKGCLVFIDANGVTLRGFTIYHGAPGLVILSNKNNIVDNIFDSNYGDGIELLDNENNISDNIFSNFGWGILICNANFNIISNNIFFDGIGVATSGDNLGNSMTNIVYNNTVNGKPLLYFEGISDTIVDGQDAGEVVLVSCRNVTIQNLEISNALAGVYLYNSNRCTIKDNILSYNNYGVYLFLPSKSNIISGNILSYNQNGICLTSCFYYHEFQYNKIKNNIIKNNGYGILFETSDGNTISKNDISNNNIGINILRGSESNSILNNDICSNKNGIIFTSSIRNVISSNNFIKNINSASFSYSYFDPFLFSNIWWHNYWNTSRYLPKLIIGWKERQYPFSPMLWYNIDWFPAREPYDIPSMR
jgi:parallel beta-helix repeat protein